MDEKSLKPQLRFKEFTDAWEQRKLSKIATMHARIGWQNLRKSEFLDSGDYYLITGTDFDDGKIDLKNCHYVAKERYEQDKNIQVKNGSILITKDGTLGKVAYVSNLQKPATLNAGVFNVELLTEDTDRKYLFQYLKAPFLMSYVSQKATGGTIKHLNQNILVDFPVIRPKKIEQQKIGTFFSNLDNLITLHQRKLDKLSNVKKALLEKMFPKNDSDVPEIRFKGFTDAWEQRKLSKIATMHARIGWQNLRKSEFLDSGDYYLITGTDFDDGKIDLKNCHYVAKERYEQDKNIQVKNGSILITKDGTLGKVAYVSNLQKPATLNAGVFNVELLTEDTDRKYLFQYLKAPFLMSYVSQKATGGTIKHLNQNILVDFPVIRPKKIEQQKIGTFFSNLDNLITLHQRKQINFFKEKLKC